MEIMKLMPTGKDYLWGGTRLKEEYNKKIDMTPLAETWECSIHPDGQVISRMVRIRGKHWQKFWNNIRNTLGQK